MLVFLVRHGHAEKGDPDELRPLSDRGRKEAEEVARQLARHRTPPRLVVTSPLLRARQTAEAIADATPTRLAVDERLRPGATAEDLRGLVAEEDGPVAAVGHQPDCSEIALALTGSDPGFHTGRFTEIVID